MNLEVRLEKFGEEYNRKLLELKEELLGDIVAFLIRMKTKQENSFRNFLFVVFVPEEENVLPEMLIYHDDRCAYCGKKLVVSEDEVKCLVCGRIEGRGKEKLMCKNGHYICEDCYLRDTAKTLLPLTVEVVVKHYKVIKERAKKLAEKYKDINPTEKYKDINPKLRFSIAFRDIILKAFREVEELLDGRMELIPLTNILVPNYKSLFLHCLSECGKNFCDPVKELLKDCGVLEE